MQDISSVRPPAISVCIPNYNYANYLAECIGSVLAQDFCDKDHRFELLIQDDCSTDEWQAVVRQFNDPRISVGQNAARLGFVGNWNACIARARGEFIVLLHADDYFLPGILSAELQQFRANPKVGMVFSAAQLVDAEGKPTGVLQPFAENFVRAPAEFLPELVRGNFVRTPTVMVRRECYERLGTFSSALSFTADWEMWLRIAAEYEVAYLATPYAAYREHAHNATRDFERNLKDVQADRDALDLFFREHPQFDSLKASAYTAASERAIEQLRTGLVEGDAKHAGEYAQLAADLQAIAGGQADAPKDAALNILTETATDLLKSHRELERWALELQAELERRDAVNKRGGKGLLRTLGVRREAAKKGGEPS